MKTLNDAWYDYRVTLADDNIYALMVDEIHAQAQ